MIVCCWGRATCQTPRSCWCPSRLSEHRWPWSTDLSHPSWRVTTCRWSHRRQSCVLQNGPSLENRSPGVLGGVALLSNMPHVGAQLDRFSRSARVSWRPTRPGRHAFFEVMSARAHVSRFESRSPSLIGVRSPVTELTQRSSDGQPASMAEMDFNAGTRAAWPPPCAPKRSCF